MNNSIEIHKKSIALIGMPGAGKSTIGILLAKQLNMSFIDTDAVIESHQGQPLQQIINESGYLALRQIEEKILLNIDCFNVVIATGGSAVYSKTAMNRLKSYCHIIYLDVTLHDLKNRIKNYNDRGITRSPGQSLKSLFNERSRLYLQYADFCINCNHCNANDVLTLIKNRLKTISST